MSFFLIALGAAVAVGLLRSWSQPVSTRPVIALIPEGGRAAGSQTDTPLERSGVRRAA